MKKIHEAVSKELELQQMLKGAIREKELGLRQLQVILLHALNLVDDLLDEMSPEAAAVSDLPEEGKSDAVAEQPASFPTPTTNIGEARKEHGGNGESPIDIP